MIHTTIKIYLEIPPKIGTKVVIYFYENILSEIDLPLKHENKAPKKIFVQKF